MSEKHPNLRIISRALENNGKEIAEYLSKMLADVNMNDPAAVLRASQDIATNYHALMFQFRELAAATFDRGISQQFRGDVERLWKARALAGFTHDLISAYAELEVVEKAAVKYFRDADHHGKRSERYVTPILPMMNWKYGLECLRTALEKEATKITSVGAQNAFRLIVEDKFKETYLSRSLRVRSISRPKEEPYALCGVHGGRDTGEYTVVETLKYFGLHHRHSFTFTEAVQFFTAHPRFLLEQDRVILLEEEYLTGPLGMMKYAFLSSPHSEYSLHVGLVSKEEADKSFIASGQDTGLYFGRGDPHPHYGKPSAAVIVVS